jgi:ribosomal protein L37AE/L43A
MEIELILSIWFAGLFSGFVLGWKHGNKIFSNERKSVRKHEHTRWICPECKSDYVLPDSNTIGKRTCTECNHTWQI